MNNSSQTDETGTVENGLKKMTINFSNGAGGFILNDYWRINEGELQFNPAGENKSFIYYNLIEGYYLSNYIISVKTRWIGGSDYSDQGIVFKYLNPKSYYILALSLDRYVIVTKFNKDKWKTIKRTKIRSNTNTYDTLKVICKGTVVECFINERKICSFKDKSIYNTSFGVCSEGDVKCGFKDFNIEELPIND